MAEPRSARTASAGAVLAVVLALLAGCASVPDSGPVREGGEIPYPADGDIVRVVQPPPAQGAAADAVVAGFLQASASFEDGHATARLFLAPEASRRWRPQTGTVVYNTPKLTATSAGDVRLRARMLAHIDGDGHYLPAAPAQSMDLHFRLRQVDGEWRVSELADGLALTLDDVKRAYRPVDLFFLDPSGSRLVPDPVFLPQLPGLSTVLVRRLLLGPSTALRGALTTAVPTGTGLALSAVPIEGGTATVDFGAQALAATAAARRALSAQVVWTLTQLPDVRSVRITVDGASLAVRGAGAVQSRETWAGYDPEAFAGSAHVVRGGRLLRFVDGDFEPVPGPAGDGKVALHRPAVSLSGDAVAGLLDGGRALVVGRLGAGDRSLSQVLIGTDLAPPSWDRLGNVWTVDRRPGGSTVWLVPPGAVPKRVVVPAFLRTQRIGVLRVSRDGTRAAILTGAGATSRLWMTMVTPPQRAGEVPRLEAPRRLTPGLASAADLAWTDSTHLAVLGLIDGEPVQPHQVSIDGYTVTPTVPVADADVVAAAPGGAPLLVGVDGDRILQLDGRRWSPFGAGRDPLYPG